MAFAGAGAAAAFLAFFIAFMAFMAFGMVKRKGKWTCKMFEISQAATRTKTLNHNLPYESKIHHVKYHLSIRIAIYRPSTCKNGAQPEIQKIEHDE